MGVQGSCARRTGGSASKFLVCTFAALTLCFAVMLAAMLGCLSMLNRINEQTRGVLMASLNNEINIARSETSFSGTLYNISDELLNNAVLVELGARESMEPDALFRAGQAVLNDVVERTQGTPTQRYLYFATSDYLMDAQNEGGNARGAQPEPVEGILDELHQAHNRMTGTYENHVGRNGDANYQLMVRTVAPGVYYIVYFPSFTVSLPESFSEFDALQLYYYDQFGNSVACSELNDLLGVYNYNTLGSDDTGIIRCKIDGVNYMGVYCTSYSRNIRMAIFFKDSTEALREIAMGVSVCMAVIVLVSLVAAIVSIHRFYRPVRVLARELTRTAGPEPICEGPEGVSTGRRSAFVRDDSAIIAEALDAYRSHAERQQGLLKAAWTCRLLRDDNPEVLGEYEDPWVSALEGRRYTVVVVRSDAPKCDICLEDVVRGCLADRFDCRVVALSSGVAAIVALEDASENDLVLYLKQMQTEYSGLEVSAFVGRPRSSVEEIASCCGEAVSAAEYFLAREIYGVVQRYEDMSGVYGELGTGIESVGSIAKLTHRIGRADVEGALAVFDETVALMQAEGERVGVGRDGEHLALLSSSVALALEALASSQERPEICSGLGACASRVLEAKNPAQVRRQLCGAMKCLASAEERMDGQKLFEVIKASTRASYRDASLSAGFLARQVGISQSQITKLFKKHNNTTFLEYLHSLRLAEATVLLCNTALTESEIARCVGYNNTVTMIRAFKKYRGIVPSALRKE